MAIKLYGTSISNYFSTAKAAMIEKNIDFEEVNTFPSDNPKVLALSPMGKVPYLEVDGSPLSETNVIFDYLEDMFQSQHCILLLLGNAQKQKKSFER